MEPFRVHVSNDEVDFVNRAVEQGLKLLPQDVLQGSANPGDEDYTYGLQPQRLRALMEHWNQKYDWRKEESKINAMGDHYKIKVASIQGEGSMNIHFVHKKSSRADAIPILLSHGWPGSIFEFHKIIPMLTEPEGDQQAFHVVAPSLPGYAWSDAPAHQAMNVTNIAYCFDQIMQAVGYSRYVAQGGDWGSIITRRIAMMFPSRCRAIHVNFVMGIDPVLKHTITGWLVSTFDSVKSVLLTSQEKRGVERAKDFERKGKAYAHIQATAPYTIGAALSFSPCSVMAYVAEKFYRWSDPSTHPSYDDIITSALIYWFNRHITSSFWLYFERSNLNGDILTHARHRVNVPTAVGIGPYDIQWSPRAYFEPYANLKQYEILEKGGHFLAFEAPDVLAKDVRAFFGQQKKAGVI